MGKKRPEKGDPDLGVGYIRVSTEDQHLGPEAQRTAVEAWAAREGVSVVSWHTEELSGGSPIDKRPALLAALEAIKAQRAGLLVVAKRDRLARDVMIAAMVERLVERQGARIVSADGVGNADGPEGLLMRTMVDAFAQYERALIRARTTAALAVKKGRGERVGQIPYGKKLGQNQKLEDEPQEQAILIRIRELRGSGALVQEIVDELNRSGVPARGSRWHPTTVVRLLGRT
jgi:DNA invertase Pin-like site-specific DNA recombinase